MGQQTFIPELFSKLKLRNKLNSPEPIQTPNSLEPQNKEPIELMPEILEEVKNPKIITKNPGPYRGLVFASKADQGRTVKSQDGLSGLVFDGNSLGAIRIIDSIHTEHMIQPNSIHKCKATIAATYGEYISAEPLQGDNIPKPGQLVWFNNLDRMNYDDRVYYGLVHDKKVTLTDSDFETEPTIVGTPTKIPDSNNLDENNTTRPEIISKKLKIYSPTPNITGRGIDSYGRSPPAEELIKSGISFVIRYIPYGREGKDLTKQELDSLLNANLSVGFIFQRYGDEFLAQQKEVKELGIRLGDSYAAGVKIAKIAKEGMDNLGVPSNIPIYFSIEADSGNRAVNNDELGKLKQFFRGCASVVGLSRVGMYGGGPSFEAVHKDGLASYFWQAGGWTPGSSQKQIYPFSNLLQYYYGGKISGQPVDFNISLKNDSGLYKK